MRSHIILYTPLSGRSHSPQATNPAMSYTASNQLPTPLPTFVVEIYQVYARGYREDFVMLGLLVGLYGM